MSERQLIVMAAIFVVMLTLVAIGIAVTLHRQKRAHAAEAQRLRKAPLPTASERLHPN